MYQVSECVAHEIKFVDIHILIETSKPPVNKSHFFQYSSFIIKLFEMIFDLVYFDTCIRRLNIKRFDSIRMIFYA